MLACMMPILALTPPAHSQVEEGMPPLLVGVNRLSSIGSGSIRVRLDRHATFSWDPFQEGGVKLGYLGRLARMEPPLSATNPHDLKIQSPSPFTQLMVQRVGEPGVHPGLGGHGSRRTAERLLWVGFFKSFYCSNISRPILGCEGHEDIRLLVGRSRFTDGREIVRFPACDYVISILADDDDAPVSAELVLDDRHGSQHLELTEPANGLTQSMYLEGADGDELREGAFDLDAPGEHVAIAGLLGEHDEEDATLSLALCDPFAPEMTLCASSPMLAPSTYNPTITTYRSVGGRIAASWSVDVEATDHRSQAWLTVWPWLTQ